MKLDDLIARVQHTAGSDELDRLTAAMAVKADFDDLTDSLIGHFVDQARRAGCSWTEIGAAMGVTKQAAQQRHTSDRPRRGGAMFSRFTPRARDVLHEAQSAADELGHSYVGTEHLLLGVMADPASIGAKALDTLGLTTDDIHAAIAEADIPAADTRRRRRHKPFTPLAKKSLELALREALTLGHNYVGTEHLVLGLLREKKGVAAKAMTAKGITRDALLAEITKLLAAA